MIKIQDDLESPGAKMKRHETANSGLSQCSLEQDRDEDRGRGRGCFRCPLELCAKFSLQGNSVESKTGISTSTFQNQEAVLATRIKSKEAAPEAKGRDPKQARVSNALLPVCVS